MYSKNSHTIDGFRTALTEYLRNLDLTVLNTVFGNTVRRVNKCPENGRDTLNITPNFMYFNHQVHSDFLSPCTTENKTYKIPLCRQIARVFYTCLHRAVCIRNA
jgi:hypothetical protein